MEKRVIYPSVFRLAKYYPGLFLLFLALVIPSVITVFIFILIPALVLPFLLILAVELYLFYFFFKPIYLRRKMKSFLDRVEFKGDEILLPEEMDLEYGTLAISLKRGRRGMVIRKKRFVVDHVERSNKIKKYAGKFLLGHSSLWDGFLIIPAVRIAIGSYKGLIFSFLSPKYRFFGGGGIEILHEEDFAKIVVSPKEDVLEITLNINMNKARGLRLEVRDSEFGKYRDVIGFFKESGSLEYSFPKVNILLISHEDSLYPEDLSKILKRKIVGCGRFYLVGILDIPFSLDKVKGVEFIVECE